MDGCCSYCYTNCTCYSSNYNLVNFMNCSSRFLMSLPSYWPIKMHKVFLDNNGIEEINSDLFNHLKLPKIEEVYLQYNRISKIENGCFENMVQLNTLQLHGNSLSFINLSIFDDLPSLKRLTLHDNPWNCSCEFGPDLRKFIMKRFISELKIIYCKHFDSNDVYMQSARGGPSVELRQFSSWSYNHSGHICICWMPRHSYS